MPNVKEIKVINLTPHDINIVREYEKPITIPASGIVARLATQVVSAGRLHINDRYETYPYNDEGGIPDGFGGEMFFECDLIPLTKTVFGKPEGLPKFKESTYYVVSQLIKSALSERVDLLVPAEVVRDEKGNIIGCKSLGI
jgi:hypothetical protein